jgi:uncharacterized SAM-binding protein YcdF (DUF218 family)
MKVVKRVVLFFFAFIVISLFLVYCSVKRYEWSSYDQAKKDKPYDVVIVPGVPFENKSTLNVLTMRMYWAKHLYDSGYTHNIIFSGSAVYTPYVESVIMKVMADSLGIPAEHIFVETQAEHSTENVYYSWKMARKMGFEKIALATDPFQSSSLDNFIEKYCPGMKSIPVVLHVLQLGNKTLPKIDPSSAYVKDFVALPDRENFWERWRGTLGKRVKEDYAREHDGK